MALAWPALLKPSSARFRLINTSMSGGPATDGSEQTVASLRGHWRFKGTFPLRGDPASIRAMEALLTAMDGRANAVLVPAFTGWLQSWPVDAQGRTLTPRFVKQYQVHLDGTAYEQPEIPTTSQINATASGAVSVGAVQMAISVTQGGVPKIGQLFGVGERLYRIFEIVSTVGAVTTVKFRPRVRDAISSGAAILFTRPVCRMKAVSDDLGPDQLDQFRFGDLVLEMREDY